VDFFLDGVVESASESIHQATGLTQLRDSYHDRVRAARSSALLDKLIDHLFTSPWITIREAQTLLKVTPAAASHNLRRLEQLNIIREETGRKRGMVFLADEIVDFMSGRTSGATTGRRRARDTNHS
jgi:Fic family protein